MACNHLLIDGKNAIYRAVYAGYNDKYFQANNYDYFSILIKFFAKYRDLFSPENCHIFWDSPSNDSWRCEVFPEYKAQRKDLVKDEVKAEVNRQIAVAIEALQYLGFRQYFRRNMEADDLIYAFCRASMGTEVVIISSDADFQQIIFNHPTVKLHNPLNKHKELYETVPDFDPVLVKAFTGDKSDNINGFYYVGKVKSRRFAEDLQERYLFLESERAKTQNGLGVDSAGIPLYRRNRLLVDLSLCPELLDNILYVEKKLLRTPVFDADRFMQVMRKHKINGIFRLAEQYVRPFETLVPNVLETAN